MSLQPGAVGLQGPQQEEPLRQLHELLGQGDVAAGEARRVAWQLMFLPEVPSHVRTNLAINHPQTGWRREQRTIDAGLLLGHFRGHYALGGTFAETTRALVIDLDNKSSKEGSDGAVPLDEDLGARMKLAELIAPRGFWVRSSRSHGLHRWVLFETAVPIDELAELALQRMRKVLAQTKGEGLGRLSRLILEQAGPGGANGILELLPYQQSGGQGATIRAPFGPGSALLEDGRTVEDPGEALGWLVDHVRREGLVRLAEAFPRQVTTQIALPGHPDEHILEKPKRAVETPRAPRSRDLRSRLTFCSSPGLPPGHLQGKDITLHLRTAEEISASGQPWGTRHQATFLLALYYKLNGYTEEQAQETAERWLARTGTTTSKEAQQSLRLAQHKTAGVVSYVYRPDAPRGGRRYRAPGKIRKGDLLKLKEQELSGGALALAVRILCFARTNSYVEFKSRAQLCELPTRELGIRSLKQRRHLEELERAGLVRLRRERLPKRDEWHPRGPQNARARLFEVRWKYSPHGSEIDEVRPISPAERTQLLAAQCATPEIDATGKGVMGAGPSAEEEAVAKGDFEGSVDVSVAVESPAPRPVGAVGAEPPKGDVEEPRPRVCGRPQRVASKGGPSIDPAASIGPSPSSVTQWQWFGKRRFKASPGGGSGGRVKRPSFRPSKPVSQQLQLCFPRRRAPRGTDSPDGGEEPG